MWLYNIILIVIKDKKNMDQWLYYRTLQNADKDFFHSDYSVVAVYIVIILFYCDVHQSTL